MRVGLIEFFYPNAKLGGVGREEGVLWQLTVEYMLQQSDCSELSPDSGMERWLMCGQGEDLHDFEVLINVCDIFKCCCLTEGFETACAGWLV